VCDISDADPQRSAAVRFDKAHCVIEIFCIMGVNGDKWQMAKVGSS
jgi:hypothetical protein